MVLLIDRKRSIGDASKEVGVQEYVIRYWITQFGDYVKPTIGNGNRRYFYDKDIKILKFIKYNLHDKGLTIKGLQNLFETENLENIKEFDNKVNAESINKIESKNSENNTITTNNSYIKTPENNKIIKDTTIYNDYKKNNFSENTNNTIYKNNEFTKKNNSNLKNDLKNLKTKLNIFYEKLKSI